MLIKFTQRTALAAIALVCIGMPAFAEVNDDTNQDITAITVTARRFEERLEEVPISMTVISQSQLTQLNLSNSADLGAFTPSLTTNETFGPEKATFNIRGFVQDSQTQPSVGVYFADVVSPRGSGLTPSGNGVGVGNLFDLQNVQVLKGPQGTLFGRNTTGGAVLLVPQKPSDKYEGYVEASTGDFGMERMQAVANAPVSDTFKVRAGVDYMKRDGYLNNLSGIGTNHLGDVDYVAARLSAVANLTPTLENYTILSYARTDDHGIGRQVAGCDAASPLGGLCSIELARKTARGDGYWDIEDNEPYPIVNDTTWQIINTTTWEANDNLTVKNIASYGQFREIARYDLIGDNFALTPGGQPLLALVTTDNTPGYDLTAMGTLTEELQFQGSLLNGKLKWQAGGYFEDSNPLGFSSQASGIVFSCQQYYQELVAGNLQCATTGSISIPFYEFWYRDRGIYSQGTYNFTDQWALTAGLRNTWDYMENRYDGTSVSFPTATTSITNCSNEVRVTNPNGSPVVIANYLDHDECKVDFSESSSKPTGTVDLEYKPNTDLLLYAKWSRGYRAGGVNGANILYETWNPEKVDTYELGSKTSFRASDVSGYFNFAGFYNDFRNQQLQATLVRNPRIGNPFVSGVVEVNAGKSRMWGFEVDSTAIISNALTLNVGYTYLNTELLQASSPPVPAAALPFYTQIIPSAVAGGVLPFSPKNRLIASLSYALPLADKIGKISFGPTFVHTDKQLSSAGVAPQFQYLPATNLVSIAADWERCLSSAVDLSFFMTNATNQKYPLSSSGTYGIFGIETQIPAPPRMWGFRVKYQFR
jgi:iron complex outermembrane recepter protein